MRVRAARKSELSLIEDVFLASALLTASTDLLREGGFTEAVLWVAETNTNARTFYERRGWKLDEIRRSREFLGTEIVEVRYCVSLFPAPH